MKKILIGLVLFSFWGTLHSQKYIGPIIDMHLHAYNQELGGMMFGMDHPNPLKNEMYKGVKTPEQLKMETFKKMDEHNIVLALTSDGQLWKQDDPERILVSGRNMPLEQLKTMAEKGELVAIGELNPFYGGVTADDASLEPLFDLAEKANLPVGFHIMPGGPPGGLYHMGMSEIRVKNANPKQLEDVLVAHPNLKVYVMHGGWPYLEDMKAMLYMHPQLYLDVAAIDWVLPKAEFHNFIKGLVDSGFGNRIMFGTDQMVWPETIDIAVDAINSAEFLTLEQKEDIFYDNAAEFLGLSQTQIDNHKNP
ncbi:amidohydrolase family protein [Muricauda oceani]|uniref:Amidohydrolase family protein n=1 Tax=Flagellimonas oceani TaxID=2698672 RepID=A0A6G7J261_9FLAO|nr:amidohydrolase family protein [Allomuricauda oceani]MBW8245072.1 amidohydrolase family protein [Allomuricauda oceani]QII44856.1 amidohydrolase family protein [Allomuricauda oceani]